RIALPLQTIIYWTLSFVILQKHLKFLRQISSSTEKTDLIWLKYFLLILVLIILVWFNLVFFNLEYLIQFTPFIYLLSVFFLAYFSLQQKEIFDFSKPELNELDEKLRMLTESEKIYLENDLSLPVLAKRLGASCNETSFVINELYQDNFYNFINKYRIEEAKKMLLSDKYTQLNVLGIAYESGFNSKTTFNTTFKKHTGMSPTEFVKSNTNLIKKEA
ncbi:MAG TPA: helix-turn-helix domain-containing protein, partial [Flavobacterium sp.]|uniref:helix-turn-helix domain-containing protein n=1 Tax=Flavobacterium sp. TaxID=239 RepID=UPI002ED4A776